MINKEWEDFFGIEEASDTSYIETDFNIKQKDAVAVLASCVNANGCVDLNWMCEASGLSMDELIHSLHGAIYQDPEVYDLCHADDQGWMLRAQYLSGHIKFKLETAKRLNHKYNDRFAANVAALKSIMPPKSDFDAIGFSIGSPWIPNEYYEVFAKDILGLARAPKISHSAALGRYHVKIASKYQDTVPNLFTYGTLHFSGLLLIEYALNGITPKPYDDVVRLDRKSGIARVLNKTESLAAQEKINLLQKAFSDWIRKNSFRVKELKKIYYNTYACNVPGRYSGCFLDLPGLNTEHFTPYPHQKDAVARIILDKDVLLNHKVGTGNRYKVDMRDAKTGGCIQRIEYALFHLNESIERIETKIKNAIEQRTNAKAEVRKGNPYASDVLRLTEKLLDIDEQLNLRTNGEESA